MKTGFRLAGVLITGVSASLLAASASAAAAATVPSAPARAGVTIPVPGFSSQLTSVTCGPSGRCWAVGSYDPKYGVSRNEVFGWTGHGWVQASVPEPRGQSGLSAASCSSAGNCMAAGFTARVHGRDAQAEVLHWGGTTWSVATAPAGMTGLQALSCAPSGSCWAVDTTSSQAVLWNGHRWGKPVQFSRFDAVNSVSCVSATDCWAAGYYVHPDGINLYNLVMHWNGRTWSKVTMPQPPGGDDQLNAIGCLSATSCWAGGSKEKTSSSHTTNELLRWDGSSWAEVPVPTGPQANSEVLGLQCLAPGDCWAVGDDNASTEALHWNGGAWSLVRTPNPGGAGFLFSVGCPRSADCLAVGFAHNSGRNLALHWNGKDWVTT